MMNGIEVLKTDVMFFAEAQLAAHNVAFICRVLRR